MAETQDIPKEKMESAKKTTSMDSNFPILLPEDPCIRMEPDEFREFIFSTIPPPSKKTSSKLSIRTKAKKDDKPTSEPESDEPESPMFGNTFIDAIDRLHADPGHLTSKQDELAANNRAFTDNLGIAHASTESHLVDLFHKLTGDIAGEGGEYIEGLLEKAWEVDSLATLKIIWNCRSIHLGKGEKNMFYVALGWLGQNHPKTLLANLQWLFRGVVPKDAKQKPDDEDTAVIGNLVFDLDDYDIVQGSSHGYWKDLLNILVLSAKDSLDVRDPRDNFRNISKTRKEAASELDIPRPEKKVKLEKMNEAQKKKYLTIPREQRLEESRAFNDLQKAHAKLVKRTLELRQHESLLRRFKSDPLHRALHYMIARFFAEQLKKDMHILEAGTKRQQKQISLCAKWAPSLEGFHDKNTLIASTIAEILYPFDRIGEEGDSREAYLKRAREKYRSSILSPLRKVLQVVERDITSNSFSKIQYSKVPSYAMTRYKELFEKKDYDGFLKYLTEVAEGKRKISGGVLMPGPMVHEIRGSPSPISVKVLNSQWQTLVQRIKDSGTLSDSIALCDTSGSMTASAGHNVACLDIAIGLSLIISSVTKKPFGGRMITFHAYPEFWSIPEAPFKEQVKRIDKAPWGMNTDFVAVFRKLILPLAVTNKVKPEDMVKRIFVFSDMQFDEAQNSTDKWATHHAVIKSEFEAAGYEMPEMIYWDIAGHGGNQNRSAPVTASTPGTALVSGHSQALLKTFLEGGTFREEEEDEVMTEEAGDGDDDDWGVVKKEKPAITPLAIVNKAIGHKAYDMLKVVD